MVSLLDRNYKCVLNITNLGNDTDRLNIRAKDTSSSDVMVLGGANIAVAPNETVQTTFIIEMSNYGDGRVFSMNVSISASATEEVTIPITVTFKDISYDSLVKDVSITGYVYDNETKKPVTGAEIRIEPWSAIFSESMSSDSGGHYTISLLSTDYLNELMATYHCRGYRGYFIQVSADGYESAYEKDLMIHGNEAKSMDFYLNPVKKTASYHMVWDKEIEYSVWRIPVSEDWRYMAVAPGRHPTGEWVPTKTHMYLYNSSGSQLWNYSVDDELWGADITRDGKYIAAGAHDGDRHIYVWNNTGSLVWSLNVNGAARSVRFTSDGRYLGGAPGRCGAGCFDLFNTTSGETVWEYETGDWVRTMEFSKGDQYAAFGSSDGYLYLTDMNGSFKWRRFHGGYVPFITEMSDNLSSIAVAGKGHELLVYDKEGNLRWSYQTEQVITAGSMTPDGSRIALGTVAGYVYFLDGEGRLLWRYHVQGISVGHNAVKLTDDGKYLIIGTGDRTMVFDDQGTVFWQYVHYSPQGTPMHPFTSGSIYVDISSDAKKLVFGTALDHVYYFEGGVEDNSQGCALKGDYPPCSQVTVSEIIDLIDQWMQGTASLSDVLGLITAWSTG
jgi:WD40 repeat protein